MPWPEAIIEAFELARPDGEKDESSFYGPYNILLNYLFPFEEKYMVTPQYKRPEQSKSVEFCTIFIVRHKQHPVFFLEIKASGHIQHVSTRQAADQQMRERFINLFDDVEINVLHGVSAIGSKLCFYTWTKETGRILPKPILIDTEYTIDTAPANRWDVDVLKREGEERLRQVVANIKTMCCQL
ncbi:hypothetical protein DFH27DRAFT_145598 [Peziza echinospora]|nr:hypothetical protein DFH27DRAFT_145598 [Peziza echinospora]